MANKQILVVNNPPYCIVEINKKKTSFYVAQTIILLACGYFITYDNSERFRKIIDNGSKKVFNTKNVVVNYFKKERR